MLAAIVIAAFHRFGLCQRLARELFDLGGIHRKVQSNWRH